MKKNILIITDSIPFPLDSGGRKVQFEMNDAIRKEHNLFLAFPIKKSSINDLTILKSKWPDVKFFPFQHNFINKISNLFSKKIIYLFYKTLFKLRNNYKNGFEKYTTLFESTSSGPDFGFIKHINFILQSNRIDIIQIEFFDFIYLISFLSNTDAKKIFIHHEIRFIREKREADLLNNITGFHNYLLVRNKGIEIGNLLEYDKILTASNDDIQFLAKHVPFKKLHCSPFTMKIKQKSSDSFNFNGSLVFLGGEDHYPNKEGLQWFLNECWLLLKTNLKYVKLNVIGKWNKSTLLEWSNSTDINFLGYVDDLESSIKNCILIVPIRIGSGIRIKVLDAINCKVPIVSTTVGVEGWNLVSGKQCYIGDTPEKFNDGIITLVKSLSHANEITENAYTTLVKCFAYDDLITKRLEAYKD